MKHKSLLTQMLGSNYISQVLIGKWNFVNINISCICFDKVCTLCMQVKEFLDKLVSRDQARGLSRPVLEDLYLSGCGLEISDVHTFNRDFPAVVCHQKLPFVLQSSTWVGSSYSSNAASMI